MTITGAILRNAVIYAAQLITSHRQEIDALNVFPVPDGDTGTNMSMTITNASREVRVKDDSESVSAVASCVASGLLRGARGNSGVILSLIFRGISKGLKGLDEADGAAIASALEHGSSSAYKAVMKPTEGTILTVIRTASEYARKAVNDGETDAVKVFDIGLEGAKAALADTEDALRFISPEVSRFISNWHVRIYRHAPGLFRVGYRAAEDHPAQFHEGSALYRYLTQGAEKLCGFIAGSGYDTVICTHTFAALMVSEVVKTHLPNLKTCFIATDYTCSPSVKDSSLDRYFIPASSLSGDFLGGGVTSERLRACGIPVRQMFRSSVRKEDAKRAFGIPADHKHLVMMCGSMGCGPIMSIARRIGRDLPDDQDLTIVCGTNKQLYRRLQRRFYDAKNVHVRSYVKDMALLMDSADLYLTKPGGISVTEAASMRLPMVFIDAVAGCEEYNKDFFLRTGGAVTGQTPKEIARTSLRLLSDKDALEKMGDALDAAVPHNAAANILSEMSEAEEEKEEDLA